MNRQLQAEAGFPLADFEVLTALDDAEQQCLPVAALAAVIGWERGRRAVAAAAPGHADLVRRLFFGGIPRELIGSLADALTDAYAAIASGAASCHPE